MGWTVARWLGRGLAVLAGLALVVQALTSLWADPRRLEELLERHLPAQLGRQASWEGLDFNLFFGLTLRNFRLQTRIAPGADLTLTARSFRLGLDWSPLLKGRLRFNRLSLTEPVLVLPWSLAGSAGLAVPTGSSGREAGESPLPWLGLEMSEVAFDQGRITFRGAGGPRLVLRQARFQARRTTGRSYDLALSFVLQRWGVTLNGQMDLDDLNGRFSLRLPKVDLPELAPFLPADWGLDLPAGTAAAHLEVVVERGRTIGLKADLAASQARLAWLESGLELTDLNPRLSLAGRLDLATSEAELTSASLRVGPQRLDLRGRWGPSGLSLTLVAPNLDLAGLERFQNLGLPPGLATGQIQAEVDLSVGPELRVVATRGRLTARRAGLAWPRTPLGPLDLTAGWEGRLDLPSGTLSLTGLEVVGPGLSARGSGAVGPGRLDLDLAGFDLDLARLWPPLSALAPLRLGGRANGWFKVKGDPGRPESLAWAGQIDLDQASAGLERGPVELVLSGALTLDKGSLKFARLTGLLGRWPVVLAGEINPWADPPAAEVNVDMEQLDLGLLWAEAGLAQGEVGPPTLGRPLSLSGRVRGARIKAGELNLEKLNLKYRLADGLLLLAPVTAELPPGNLALNMVLDLTSPQASFQGQASLTGAPVQSLPPEAVSHPALGLRQGRATVKASFGGRWPGWDNLSAQVSAEVLDGQLAGNVLLEELSRFTGVARLRTCDFETWRGSFELGRGRLDLRGDLAGGPAPLHYAGRVDKDGRLRLELELRLPSALALDATNPALVNSPVDEEGRRVLPLIVTGQGGRLTTALDPARQTAGTGKKVKASPPGLSAGLP